MNRFIYRASVSGQKWVEYFPKDSINKRVWCSLLSSLTDSIRSRLIIEINQCRNWSVLKAVNAFEYMFFTAGVSTVRRWVLCFSSGDSNMNDRLRSAQLSTKEMKCVRLDPWESGRWKMNYVFLTKNASCEKVGHFQWCQFYFPKFIAGKNI